jgi:hypothetical protein
MANKNTKKDIFACFHWRLLPEHSISIVNALSGDLS